MGVDVVRAVLGIILDTRIRELFQIEEWEIAWTIWPRAQSLLAMSASGVRLPGARPSVWSSGNER